MEGCLYLIKQYAPNLSPSERKAADYLVTYPAQAVHMGIATLAAAAGTSTAAVIRLANRMGYGGYTELRLSLAQEVFSTGTNEKQANLGEINESTPAGDIVKILVGMTTDSMAGVETVLDRTSLERAVETIMKSHHVMVAGIGASGIVATDFQQKLARLGLLAVYTADSDMQVVQACALKPEDCLVAISYSGETGSIIKAAREGRRNGAPILAVTRIGGNSLSKLADIILTVPNSESLFRQGASLSRINQLLVVDIIFAMILARYKGSDSSMIQRTWEAVSHVSGGSERTDDLRDRA